MEECKTLFIPCAGSGTRVAEYADERNKALITIGDKPAISHIIDRFPLDWEIVVALGYDGDNVRNFLEVAYPDRKISFVEVSVWEGPGSGLARTLWESRSILQKPFIFWANDTICDKPRTDSNTLVYYGWDKSNSYRKIDRGYLNDKKAWGLNYVGVAVILDYELFWQFLNKDHQDGECSAINGMMGIVDFNYDSAAFWIDTGNKESLEKALSENKSSYNILPKRGEATWFVNDYVIKYHKDPLFISNRVRRASLLQPYVPKIEGHLGHFYSYKRVPGVVLSENLNRNTFRKLLGILPDFWKGDCDPSNDYVEAGLKFYRDKTLSRVDAYLKENTDYRLINDHVHIGIFEMLGEVDWQTLSRSRASRWHGDLHFENILVGEKLTFLDWREDYAGLDQGDYFYDLAKLYHGILFPHKAFSEELFRIAENGDTVFYDYSIPLNFVECIDIFRQFCYDNWIDFNRVKLITALVFLNMSPLHPGNIGKICFCLGKELLQECLKTHS